MSGHVREHRPLTILFNRDRLDPHPLGDIIDCGMGDRVMEHLGPDYLAASYHGQHCTLGRTAEKLEALARHIRA